MNKLLIFILLFSYSLFSQVEKKASFIRTLKPESGAGPPSKAIRDRYIPKLVDDIFLSSCEDYFPQRKDCEKVKKTLTDKFDYNRHLGVVFITDLLELLSSVDTTDLLESLKDTKNLKSKIEDHFQYDMAKVHRFIGVIFQDTSVSRIEESRTEITKTGTLREIKSGKVFYKSQFIVNINFIIKNFKKKYPDDHSIKVVEKNKSLLSEIISNMRKKTSFLSLPDAVQEIDDFKFTTRALYHYYTMAYFKITLEELPLDSGFTSQIPFILNANYEILQDKNGRFTSYFNPFSDTPVFYRFFPEEADDIKNSRNVLEDTYMGLLATQLCVDGDQNFTSFSEFKKSFESPKEYMKNIFR